MMSEPMDTQINVRTSTAVRERLERLAQAMTERTSVPVRLSDVARVCQLRGLEQLEGEYDLPHTHTSEPVG